MSIVLEEFLVCVCVQGYHMLTAWAMPAIDETTSWSLPAHEDCKGLMLTAGLGLPMMKQPHQRLHCQPHKMMFDGMSVSAVIVE